MKHLNLFGYGLIGAAALALFIWVIKALTLWFITGQWSPWFLRIVFGTAGIYVLGGLIDAIIHGVRRG